ncbi:MAG: 3-oxoacyl-[acyl-carrier-protein] synthase III C-terminal domain-containing protein [Solirubrobacteraceae bacterium]
MNAIDTTAVRTATVDLPADGRSLATGPRISGLTVSDGEHVLSQDQVLDRLGLRGDEFAERIFAHSGVKRRHLDLDDDFLARTLQGRTAEVEERLLRHSVRAVARLGLDPAKIGTVLSSSLYSLGLPTLAHRLVDHYEMDPATDKYHITGVACASAVPLMRMAAGTLHQHPGRDCLIVAAESMSSILTRAGAEDPRAKTVGSALFGDGCAAAVLSADPGASGPRILATRVHQLGGTLGAVSLSCTEQDTYLHLIRELPDLAGAGLPGVAERFLREHRVEHAEIDHWMVHPGGRRIIENIQSALELSDEQTATSWNALANHGNVGTPSIFYVLQDTIAQRDPQPGERGLAVTIGPGVTVGLMLLQW